MGLLTSFLFVWLVGLIPLLVVVWATQPIQACWLRQLPRAFVAALIFAPSYWSEGMCNGAPVPALFLFLGRWHNLEWHQIFNLAGLPVMICFLIGYGLACLCAYGMRPSKPNA